MPFDREAGSSARLLARAACRDVTPRNRPVRLAGYALREMPVSTVLDPIEISALLLECGAERCLILSFDLMLVGTELQKLILARLERLGFLSRQVALLASHTHTAPATDQACHRLGAADVKFVDDAADAAEELVSQILRQQPSEVSIDIFRGQLDHSVNRRRYWPFPTIGRTYGFRWKSVIFSPDPSGPTDEHATVALLRKASDGQALGVIWHYTCHPTAVVPVDVISADYPGRVRHALRERFGQIPCVFAQGFCGDIRPNITVSQQPAWRERLRRSIRTLVSGPLFPSPSPADWMRWSQSLAAKVDEIARGTPVKTLPTAGLQTGSAEIPLGDFFSGVAPDKPLAAQVLRIGNELEIVTLSAEVTVGWQRILDAAAPVPDGRIRLYTGYLGALYGYLPTAAQVREGGYEVEGFQPLFGLSGHFEPASIGPAVVTCVKSAFEDLERAKAGVIE
jgi:hypothetical protein